MSARKSSSDRKTEIIGAALHLAERLGPDRMTTNDVAQAVGLTQPGVFRHFPTKHALWLAVAEHIAERLDEAWNEAVTAALTPEDRLRALVMAQLTQIEVSPALPMILFSHELNSDNAGLRGVFRTLLARFQDHLMEALKEMQASGDLRQTLAVADAALFFTALVQGLAIRRNLIGRGFPLVEEGARLFDLQRAMMRPGASLQGD